MQSIIQALHVGFRLEVLAQLVDGGVEVICLHENLKVLVNAEVEGCIERAREHGRIDTLIIRILNVDVSAESQNGVVGGDLHVRMVVFVQAIDRCRL